MAAQEVEAPALIRLPQDQRSHPDKETMVEQGLPMLRRGTAVAVAGPVL